MIKINDLSCFLRSSLTVHKKPWLSFISYMSHTFSPGKRLDIAEAVFLQSGYPARQSQCTTNNTIWETENQFHPPVSDMSCIVSTNDEESFLGLTNATI